jgi:putative transposase
MVTDPVDYSWSSHRCNAYGGHDPLVSQHAAYLSLSSNPLERQRAYRFLVAIEAQLGRPAGPRKVGRPRKSEPLSKYPETLL